MIGTIQKKRILVVEDETDVRELILLHLRRDGHEAIGIDNGEEALRLLQGENFDLAVLDWMLPGFSGLEVCKQIRGQLPVLMVTARADSADIVAGLEAGADDYVVKPFEVPVFLARVRALIRRSHEERAPTPASTMGPEIQIGALRLNTETYRVTCEEAEISLTPSEFKLLVALSHHRGKVLSRERLIQSVQGQGVSVVDRTIDTHVFGLRKKLGPCSGIIETIRGVGYRIEGG